MGNQLRVSRCIQSFILESSEVNEVFLVGVIVERRPRAFPDDCEALGILQSIRSLSHLGLLM